ncbi:polysaccharide deacetylase family protein [Nocardioides dongkuii]|uniref:polysaccharide deacetylase family protein n=1 Tax=Nocardioides dongkuii TaxID=2760089 RepID=UPI0015FD9134|nr:polysaccharide deacetylase family protein [Nocardioides dongkuii]
MTLPVLMYHAVGTPMPARLADLTVPPALLAEQLAALTEAGYALLGLSDALAAHADGRAAVALTFDDAYADFVENATGVLATAGAGATLYVPTRDLGGTASWLADGAASLPLMSASDVVDVAAEGIEVGSHGAVHVPMDVLRPVTAAAQLGESRVVLEDLVQRPVVAFCYPHGYHARRLRRQVAAAGYEHACAIGHRLHTTGQDRYAVPRLHVTADHDPEALVDLVARGPGGLRPLAKRAATPAWRTARRVALRTTGRTWT